MLRCYARAGTDRPLTGRGRAGTISLAVKRHAPETLVAGVDSSTQACKVVVRDAASGELVREGRAPHPDGAEAVGLVPVASFTVTKLRWLADHEPGAAARVAAVCLPHDWLTWRLAGGPSLDALATDRGDASGTGYWSPATGGYRPDLLRLALGHDARLPAVLEPAGSGGTTPAGAVLAAGTGDNMAAALGLGARPGDVVVSVGTSGTVFAVAERPSADATGRFLPLVCTLNAARVLDAAAAMLGVGLDRLSELALDAPAGAGGLTLIPYLEGERTPNRPTASGALHGLRLGNATPACLARAAVEGLLCGLADGLDALVAEGVAVERVLLIGGGARSEALRRIAPAVLGLPVVVPPAGEYVADGAARQAAWALAGGPEPPPWAPGGTETFEADPAPEVRERYAASRDLVREAARDDGPAGPAT